MSEYCASVRTAFLRQLRAPVTFLVGIGVPFILIVILGYSFAGVPGIEEILKGRTSGEVPMGNPAMTLMAMIVIVMFQLFSGGFVMSYMNDAYYTVRKWRMLMLPCRPAVVVSGMLTAGLGVSMLQGAVLAALSTLALGANLGAIGIFLLVFLGLSLFAQLLSIVLLLCLRSYRPAFSISWLVAYGSCAMAGMIFPLPMDKPAVRFMTEYGSPAALAKTALMDSARGGPASEIALCLGVLFLASALLGLLAFILMKRRPA